MKKNKIPGFNGLTVELFQEFPILIQGLLNMWNFSIKKKILPINSRKGIIFLIHKKNAINELSNYRQ